MPKPIRRIGASKLATVSECQTPQGVHVAAKEYNRQPLSSFQHERIFAAAQRWKTLTIPGLAPYLEVNPAENLILMELFDRSAAMRLSEGHSDPRLVLHAMRGILAALAQLHEQGLLHVNLKPSNVFFDSDGRARLSDGLLLNINAPVTLPPPTNQKYLTPEHTSDAFGPMSPATDLYAVGFMALELLAGDRFGRAFQGIGDDAGDDDLAWFQWHGSSQEAPSATAFSKTCPAELTAVIARLVAKQPSIRYASARAALQDLPQDIAVQAKVIGGANQTPVSEAKREALSSHVVERPATGIVVAVASGPRAGEMVGTNDNEFMLGFDHDCFLRFSPEQYPHGSGKVLVRRSSEGWYALRVSGDSAFVNQLQLEEKRSLRSGDIIRLSSRGPDVQFTMQSGGVAVRSLVSRFLPSQSKQPVRPPGAGANAAKAPPSRGAAPAPAAAVAPARPNPVPMPAGGASPAPSKPVVAAPVKAATSKAAPTAPLPAKGANPATPNKSTTSDPKSSPGGFSWLSPATWSKNQKNTVIAVVGGILVIIAVILFPSSSPSPQNNKEEAPNSSLPASIVTGETNSGEATPGETESSSSAAGSGGKENDAAAAEQPKNEPDAEAESKPTGSN